MPAPFIFRRPATRPGLLLLAAAVGVCLAAWTPETACAQERVRSNIDAALAMYEAAKQVQPSRIGAEDYEAIIRKRVQCYDAATTPLERKRPCNITYVDAIIRTARNTLKSPPLLGLFIHEVQYCPTVYSMCIGEHMNKDACVTVERQCIDQTLDKYWRGTAPNGSRD